MGMGMGMARALCPSYIQDVVHPRNGWLETVLPPAMTAAGILLGQVGTYFTFVGGPRSPILRSPPGLRWPPLMGLALSCTGSSGSSTAATSPPP